MSEQPYPPFSGPDTTCPKCSGPVLRLFMPAGTKFHGSQNFTAIRGEGPEWLLRTCSECGYRWPEMCADVYPETAVQNG